MRRFLVSLIRVDKAPSLMLRSGGTRLSMPKKTKKAKLLAEYHRQTISTSPHSPQEFESPWIKKDLAKTLVLAIGIVAIELALTKWLP